MKQTIADPTFGLDSKVQAILSILATREPTWAIFNERAQMFEASFRTGIFYEEGVDPKVWIAMFPTFVARGPCSIVTVGVDLSGRKIRVEPWGLVKNFPERTSPDAEWRINGELSPFDDVLPAVQFIEQTFSENYEGLKKGRLTLVG